MTEWQSNTSLTTSYQVAFECSSQVDSCSQLQNFYSLETSVSKLHLTVNFSFTDFTQFLCDTEFIVQIEIRSVERRICPIATSTMNELFL